MTLAEYLRALPGRCAGCGMHVERQGCRCATDEWTVFVTALRTAARPDGLIHQGDVRPLIQRIPHKHRGQLYRRARTTGLIAVVGKEPSTDAAGRNTDKDSRVYRLRGAA